jgi:hypothetical protein
MYVLFQVNYGLDGVKLMTFGQPRIGNEAFASYFKVYLPHAIRVTNAHDIVPHLPPYFTLFPQKTYHHFPREVCSTVAHLLCPLVLIATLQSCP